MRDALGRAAAAPGATITDLVPETPALTSALLLPGPAQSRKGLLGLWGAPASATLVCKAGGVRPEEKTLLWMLLPTLMMTRLVFLPPIFVTQLDWSRHWYSWSCQAINLLLGWAGTVILFSYM